MKNMDYRYIEQLLERYWQCETSLEEEEILRTFFSQKDVPATLLLYRDLFAYEKMERQAGLGEDFDRKMMRLADEQAPVKARLITMPQRMAPLFKAAAVVAIFLTLGNAAQMAFDTEGTPDAALTTGFRKTVNGPSVAMNDSARTDTTMRKVALPTATILK